MVMVVVRLGGVSPWNNLGGLDNLSLICCSNSCCWSDCSGVLLVVDSCVERE